MIRLFPYKEWKIKPYNKFRRWVPLPPNPPPITKEEKQDAAIIRVKNHPLCYYGVRAKLHRPNIIGVPSKFTLFLMLAKDTCKHSATYCVLFS
jgi:hypothetical protein